MTTYRAALSALMFLSQAHADSSGVANGINRFGLDLHRRLATGDQNLVISPWSIETALAMTYAGADGKTKAEMAKVLHFQENEEQLHDSFAGLSSDLVKLAKASEERIAQAKKQGGPTTPLQINIANRLFGQKDYPFIQPFLDLNAEKYHSPLEKLDFRADADGSRKHINQWVETQTREKIKDLIPSGVLGRDTSLVLANAVYLKAPWADEFRDEPNGEFHPKGGSAVKVPMLTRRGDYGFARWPGTTAVTIPYADGGLQFVMLVPDEVDGLAATEKSLSAERFAETAKAGAKDIELHFPSFKLEPERVMLADELKDMGMPSAFDEPKGSADFSRMGPRQPDDYLYISHVIHKAFVAVDKHGTEAAAATAVVMTRATAAMPNPEKPLVVRVDRPFVFAIQHIDSGTCLFLGRVTDPR
jgi:serpin B